MNFLQALLLFYILANMSKPFLRQTKQFYKCNKFIFKKMNKKLFLQTARAIY